MVKNKNKRDASKRKAGDNDGGGHKDTRLRKGLEEEFRKINCAY